MDDHKLTIFQGFIGMLLDGIELNALSFTQFSDLLRQSNPQPSFQNPANFVVVMMHLRLGKAGALLGLAQQTVSIGVANGSKEETLGIIELRLF